MVFIIDRFIHFLVVLYSLSLPLEGVFFYLAPGVTIQRVLGITLAGAI
jgi:hypothetical protein